MSNEYVPPLPEQGPIIVEIDPELMDLLDMFLDARRAEVPALREAVRSGDHDTVREVGHRMKGIGGGYGFDYVTTVGGALEGLAKSGDLRGADRWIDGLEDYLQRVEPTEGPEEW